MRLILETDSKKRPVAQKSYSGVMGFRMARGKYSDALLSAIFKKIFKRLNLIDFTVTHKEPLVVGMAKYFLNNELNVAFAELFNNGFLLFLKKKDANGKLTGIKYIRKAQATQDINVRSLESRV